MVARLGRRLARLRADPPARLRASAGSRSRPPRRGTAAAGGCNSFSFRFERVEVAAGRGGSWKRFVGGFRFQDAGYRISPSTRRPRPARPARVAPRAVVRRRRDVVRRRQRLTVRRLRLRDDPDRRADRHAIAEERGRGVRHAHAAVRDGLPEQLRLRRSRGCRPCRRPASRRASSTRSSRTRRRRGTVCCTGRKRTVT